MRFFWLLLVALGLGTKRHWHILFAIVLGVGLGLVLPIEQAVTGQPLPPEQYPILHKFFDVVGQIFIRLITMIVVPLVVSSLIVGVSSLGDGRQLGRMGGKVLTLFLGLMIIASLIGGSLAMFFEPGQNIQIPSVTPLHVVQPNLRELLFNMIPQNPLESLAKADLVPVILFTLLFGMAIANIGDAGKPLVSFFEAVFTATMKITDWVMIFSVPGIFSLTFITVAKSGMDIIALLAPYALVILIGLLIQAFIVLPLMLKVLAKIDFLNLYRAISEAIMVAFGTASSSATLPITIACCERRAGISNRIASFVLPTGVTINKTATTMFEVVAVMFLAQAYQIPLAPHTVVLIMVFAIIASIGTAGVPSGGLMTIFIVFNSLGNQVTPEKLGAGLALLWGIDRALDMCRTVVNVMSSCAVAAVVASHEGELNRDILNNREVWMEVV